MLQLTDESAKQVLAERNLEQKASLRDKNRQAPANFVKLGPYALGVAGTIEIPGPFQSVMMKSATDDNVEVSIILNDKNNYTIQNAFPMNRNESLFFKDPILRAWLKWSAQSGKTATFYVAVDAEIRSGKITTVQSGGVSINEGTSVETEVVTLAAGAATELFEEDANAKVRSFRNDTGGPLYLGPSTVTNAGATKGFEVAAGEIFEWRNTSALYAYNGGAAADVVTMTQT
jgi:hypothetical protein